MPTTPYVHRPIATAAASIAIVAMIVSSCGGLHESKGPQAKSGSLADDVSLQGASYTVGSKSFDEALVLCEMTVAALESVKATVNNRCNVGGTEATRNAMIAGQIDAYWEYTGTAWVTFFGEKPIQNAQAQYDAVKRRDQEKNQVVWLAPSRFNNTYAFAVQEAKAQELGLTKLSDMADYIRSGKSGTVCIASEYLNRDDGMAGLQKTYGFQIPQSQLQVRQEGAIYQGTANPSDCLFGEVFTTDGRIPALKLRVLKDDKTYHPLYNAALTIRQKAFDQNPDVAKVFEPIAAKLTDEVMSQLNAKKSAENIPERKVARDWLMAEGFISG